MTLSIPVITMKMFETNMKLCAFVCSGGSDGVITWESAINAKTSVIVLASRASMSFDFSAKLVQDNVHSMVIDLT